MTLKTETLAVNPMNIPKAVHICHETARPPLILAGAHSAAYMLTVLALIAKPIPSRKRSKSNIGQFWLKADPMLAIRQIIVPTNMAPRRPSRLLMGSDSHAPLLKLVPIP